MKRLRKILSVTLCIAVVLSLCSTISFADWNSCQRSKQKLTVDDVEIECDKYNINGSNYFKLRDIAYLLNGTGSQFSVNWDAENKCIGIDTAQAYVPNKSELIIGADLSSTAQKSTARIIINGYEYTTLSVYNIGGNNYFKLRDLGKALNFFVDYDAASNTAQITSEFYNTIDPEYREIWYVHDVYELVESFGSFRTVYLAPGVYNLTDFTKAYAKANEQVRSNYKNISREYALDTFAPEIRLQNCELLKLIGSGEGVTSIVCEPRYANVLGFDYCYGIEMSFLTLGHTIDKGYCTGAVIDIDCCDNFWLENLDLYGCGTYGITAMDSFGLYLTDSVIRDCSYGAIDYNNVEVGQFAYVTFKNNGDLDILNLNNVNSIFFYECTFTDNHFDLYEGCGFISAYDSSFIEFTGCSFGADEYESLISSSLIDSGVVYIY